MFSLVLPRTNACQLICVRPDAVQDNPIGQVDIQGLLRAKHCSELMHQAVEIPHMVREDFVSSCTSALEAAILCMCLLD